MQNATAGGPSMSAQELPRAIISDLMSLIAQVRTSMALIEAAIPDETPPGYQEIGSNVVVLDDVTPRYESARAALKICEAQLGATLRLVLDTRTPQPGTVAAGVGPYLVRSGGRA